ncbi:epithelial sodium channel subunit gamma [Lonchura striata]|uniref:Amiloride-sensitive sodium channel subunit gamma n=1 Tax=Lonchura striata TaxID=40157 RepID=A0A218UCS1_9PASE|nr:amiloride-sensitive sodium channel subunit gamma [Lonchura striata domestica]OWK51577.1 Amiloride-sensitive sodium channel subunit gamma [Lonchura striata domestica]
MAPPGPEAGRAAGTAPGKKITARLKRTLPVRGPQAPTLSELMRWYCLNTNTHGCRRIVVSRGRLRRLLWILLTLSAVGLILWQCAELLMNYYSASVSVTVQFQKLPFPAVTICNINPYKYSAMKEYLSELDKETKKALETFYGFSEGKSKVRRSVEDWNSTGSDFFEQIPLLKVEDFSRTATELHSGQKRRIEGSVFHKDSSIVNSGDSNDIIGFQLCDANNSSECALYTFSSGVNAIQEWYKLHYMNIMAQIPLETKEKLSYSAEDFLLTCFFDGISCDKRHFTRFHHPLHGNCYTFNSGESGTILSTSTGGSEYGLQVVLYIDEAEYNPFLVTSTGAKIMIHDQNEYPFIEDIGTEIETAAATSIGMHFTQSRKLSKPYSDCTETGADIPVENLYNKSYSLQICLHSCFQKAMVDSCGCAQYAQPLPAGAEYCNYKKNPNWMYCYYRLHEKFVKEQLGCQQICKDACSFKEWALTTSIAQWPSVVSEDWMLRVLSWDKGQKLNKKLNKTDLANLMVFYKDLNERFISENPANTLVILLSNFGGQLGLWMSCSVVCVIEIVEVFFIDSLSIVTRHQWQRAKKWWSGRRRGGAGQAQAGDEERQGHDNPACVDEDLPTFTTALRLPLPQDSPLPRTPPPNYSTLRLETAFTEQLPDTLELGRH